MLLRRICLLIGFAVWPVLGSTSATEPNREQLRFFEEKVRPVLANRCFRCHGEDKQKGNLRLDSRSAAMTGGESGAALTPGNPDESLLIQAVRYESLEMPPDGELPAEEIEVLASWVNMGAPWPAEEKSKGSVRDKGKQITDEDREYWAFQPVKSVSVPQVDDSGWSRTDIDRFVFERLASAGLSPSPAADRRTLIRRLYLDLIGLPPSPEAVESFVADESPDAYANVVDQLLNSPRYGEKWSRHWLDLVRYAESDGFKQDAYRPQSWRYRDYVIRALNQDKPYDQFIREQLAGDELAESDLEALAATAYLRHWIYEYNQRDVRTQWSNILNDITDVTAEVFLGLSVGCARCHDHKFDPILQKDYFRLQAFFAPLLPRDDIPFLPASERQQYESRVAEWEKLTHDLRREMELIEQPVRAKISEAAVNKFPPDIRPMFRKSLDQRTPFEQQLVDLAERQVAEEYSKLDMSTKLKGEDKAKWLELKKQLAAFDKEKPTPPANALTVTDVGPLAPVTFIPGDRTKRPIPPGFLSVLDSAEASVQPPTHARSTGRRTVLANWIASAENPLTARVAVNRIWQYHFGQGIVQTSSDFGHLGESPSHPELLDWLTRSFIDGGWSFKKLHRLVVTSATYQQMSRRIEDEVVRGSEAEIVGPASGSLATFDRAQQIDPENRLLWHMPIRRLDAEQIRDAVLAVSGELKLDEGGPSVDTSQPRRTIYTKVLRNERDPLLDVFDSPDNFSSTAMRNVTTTPTQALFMINGAWMLERANALAKRLEQMAPADNNMKVRQVFLLAYGRAPTSAEQASGVAFLAQGQSLAEQDSSAGATASFAPFPGREGMALDVQPLPNSPQVVAPNSPSLPDGDFTVEAFVLLRSLYQDASVRTIASQWDSNNKNPGWSLGVTSSQSRYEPRNLILQLVGATKEGSAYDVVPSNFRLELNKPYYVAARIRLADMSDKGITFWVKDLSDEKNPLQSVGVPHKVITGYRSTKALVIGGRDGNERHRWDGLIDDVVVSSAALADERLSIHSAGDPERSAGLWRFEAQSGILHDTSPNSNHLTYQTTALPRSTAGHQILVDFCHVLLNSNEFLYVD